MPPFRVNWRDQLFGWVRQLPLPTWFFYLSLYIYLLAIFTLLYWWQGVENIFFPLLLPVIVWLLQHLLMQWFTINP